MGTTLLLWSAKSPQPAEAFQRRSGSAGRGVAFVAVDPTFAHTEQRLAEPCRAVRFEATGERDRNVVQETSRALRHGNPAELPGEQPQPTGPAPVKERDPTPPRPPPVD